MTDYNKQEKEMLKTVTRRYMLRNSSIAATGALLLPSFITSCKKEDIPDRGLGGVQGQLSTEDLQKAADNLTRMRVWITDLYPLCVEYEDAVFHALAATKETGGWTNFLADIFIDIATVLAAAAAIVSGGAAAVPAFAFLSAVLHDWGIGKDKPSNLDGEFASFQFGHVRMQLAMEQKLSALVDPANNYSNLTAAWTDDIPFNGNTYKLADLATANFPGLGVEYNTLQTAALESFEKALWNLVIMKCCTFSKESRWTIDIYNDRSDNTYPYHTATEYAQQKTYPGGRGQYLRGRLSIRWDSYRAIEFQSWNLGIGGNVFPDAACDILFKDDTPGHIINPTGLFNRTYVFQQFALTKPEMFLDWKELSTSVNDFDLENDWNFTGGMFPKLTH
ncbi:MAG: hypothetical protein ABIQ31_03870 [Ferruginibacter sp.]